MRKPGKTSFKRSPLAICRLSRIGDMTSDHFFEVLNGLNLDDYDYVVKLHTKRTHSGIVNHLPLFGGQWRRKLLSFCKNRKVAEKALALMDNDPAIGMIGNAELIMRPCDELVHSPIPDRSRYFIAGTMFLARASALKIIQGSAFLSDFELFAKRNITTLAHDYERKFGYALCDAGWKVVGFPRKTWFYIRLRPFGKLVYRTFLQPLISINLGERQNLPDSQILTEFSQ